MLYNIDTIIDFFFRRESTSNTIHSCLDCKCSFGDGWHGGYVEINEVKYCDDFTRGHEKQVEVSWGP